MPKAKKKETTDNFEQALAKLEKVVESLEEGDLSLEKGLKAFEDGMRLAKVCEQRLNEAKGKVEVLLGEKITPLEEENDFLE